MTAAGSRPFRTGRVAAPDCLTHMCHHVHAADQRDLHLALLQTNDHSTVPGPVIASSLLPIAQRSAADQSHNARDQAIQFQAAKLRREFARNSEQQKILLGAPPTSQIEEGVSVHNGGYCPAGDYFSSSQSVT